jgi:hypothetical protein
MPREETHFYVFGGWATQDYYSEEEMAEALDMTVEALRAALDPSEYGPRHEPEHRGYCFHAHPFATGGKFLFTRGSYRHNLRVYQWRKWLQKRGEWDDIAFWFISSYVNHYQEDTNPMTETEFLERLAEYRERFNAKDGGYHYSIREYWRHK